MRSSRSYRSCFGWMSRRASWPRLELGRGPLAKVSPTAMKGAFSRSCAVIHKIITEELNP